MTQDVSAIQERSDCCRLLAAALYEPEKELFVDEDLCGNLKAVAQKITPDAEEDISAMAQALTVGAQDELALDHAALFIGPFSLLAPPYGSIYLENKGQLMGDSTMEVVKFYRRHGLEPEIKDVPDHICFELEFLSYLAAKEAEALNAGDSAVAADYRAQQREFLGGFLAPWIPAFCDRIRANSNNDFYKSLADCLQKCLGAVEKTLQEG